MSETLNPDRHTPTPSPSLSPYARLHINSSPGPRILGNGLKHHSLPPTSRRRNARRLHPSSSLTVPIAPQRPRNQRPDKYPRPQNHSEPSPPNVSPNVSPSQSTYAFNPPHITDPYRRRLPRRLFLPSKRRQRRIRVQYLSEYILRAAERRGLFDVWDCIGG